MKKILHMWRFRAFLALLFLSATGNVSGQVSIGALPYNKADNFNTYNGSGPGTLPTGWSLSGAANYRGTGTGTSNTGGFYAFGSGSDFSLGALRSSTNNYTYAVSFTNNSGNTITSLTISWNYEQWRYANTSGWDVTGTGALASNATLNGKDFAGNVSGTSGSVTTTAITTFTLSVNIPNGQTFGISWVTNDVASSDNGVSIDDFSLQATGAGGPQNQTITFNALTNQTYGVAPYALSATATSGLPVSFASSNTNVATVSGNTITIVGAGATNITASQAGNGSFNAATNVVRALLVNPKAITSTGATASNKIYNRTTAATITGATAVGTVNGDVITITGGGTFADANVGSTKPVTAVLTLSGTKASSYALTQPTGLTASITPKDLTIATALVSNKEYDGNTSATLSGVLSGVIAPDDVNLNFLADFESPFVGTAIPVISNAVLSGADIDNYTLVQLSGLTADITPKQLTILGATVLNKIFDGNTDAIITGTLTGVIAPDDVAFVGTGTFASPNIGVNIPVTSTSIITGDVFNYTLVQPTGLMATISSEALLPQTIAFDVLPTKTYGDAEFQLTAEASSGLPITYFSSNTDIAVVSGNTVTIVGVGTTTFTATQAGDSTYDAAPLAEQALVVIEKEITVSDANAQDKVYDGNDVAIVTGNLTGIVGTDVVTLNGNGTFASSNAGNNIAVTPIFMISGADAAKYILLQPAGLSANISQKLLSVNGTTAQNKPYDGTTTAIINGMSLLGVVGADEVTVEGNGTFASANVGTAIVVNASLTLTGSDAGNYSIGQPSGLMADITPLALTINGLSVSDKVYDATTTAILSGTAALNGVIAGEENDVTLIGSPIATFNNKNVGNNKPVTVSGLSLDGAFADNYILSAVSGLTGSITAKALIVSGAIANNKSYDGTTLATLSNTGVLSGIETADVGNVSISTNATFASAAIGTGIIVNLSLTGSAASNYMLVQPGITADITVSACGSSTINWDFASANPSSAALPGLTVSALAQGNNNGSTVLITAVSVSNNAGASGGNNAGAAARIGALNLTASAYFEFKLTPAAGYKATLTGINFGSRETSTGPKAYAIRSSLDNFASNIVTGVLPASSVWTKYTPAIAPTSGNAGAEITYRIYGYNGIGSPASGTANWRIDDLNLLVSISPAMTGNLNPTACSGEIFNYTPTSAVVDATFTWTRAAVIGISNAAITTQQSGSINEVLVNTTSSPVDVTYAFRVTANNCYTVQNIVVEVLPQAVGGTVSGSAVVCSETNNTTFTLNGHAGNIVKWQSSAVADFSTSVDIANASTNLTVTNVTSDTYYRAVVGSGACTTVNSDPASIAVVAPVIYFQDADGDGYGNPAISYSGCAQTGYVTDNTDCNDTVTTIHPNAVEIPYNGVDDDCDASIDETGTVNTSLLATSCGVTLASIQSLVGIQTVGGHLITGYRIRITNGSEVQVIEKTVPHFTIPQFPFYAYATTYAVDVQLQRAGIWMASWGPTCLVSTPAILEEGGAAAVSPSQCGLTLPKITTLIATGSIQGVTGYRFRVTNLTDPTGPNAVQQIDRTQNWFSLQMLTRYNFGSTYRIEVAVKTTGTYSGFGTPCEVTSPAAPSLVNCGGTAASGTATIAAASVQGATQYRFQIVRDSDGASTTMDRNTNWFIFNSVPAAAFSPGALYNIRVAVMTTGTWSPFGDICQITSPGIAAKGMQTSESVVESTNETKITAFPNPFTSNFSISVDSFDHKNVTVRVYDMLGRMVESQNRDISETFVLGDDYPSGVYNVIISQESEVKTLRVIKR